MIFFRVAVQYLELLANYLSEHFTVSISLIIILLKETSVNILFLFAAVTLHRCATDTILFHIVYGLLSVRIERIKIWLEG